MTRTPPRILHVAMPFARSGSAVTNVIRAWAREHHSRGGETGVVVSSTRPTQVDFAEVLSADHTRVSPREYFSRRQMISDHLVGSLLLSRPYTGRLAGPSIEAARPFAPDVILVHEGHYASSTIPAWRNAFPAAQICLYVHTSISRAYRPAELAKLYGRLDQIIFVSDFMRRASAARLPRNVRLNVVLNGSPPGSAHRPGSEKEILFVGQLGPHKGAHLLVEAARLLATRGGDFRLTIVGSSVHGPGAETTDYERQLVDRAAPLGSRVTFTGFLDHAEVAALYARATVVCIPSMFDDPCPLVVLEALSTGSAIVTTRRGGIPEIAEDSVAYVREDPASLATELARFLDDAAYAHDHRQKAAKRAAQVSWPKQYDKLLGLIASG